MTIFVVMTLAYRSLRLGLITLILLGLDTMPRVSLCFLLISLVLVIGA